MNIGEIFNTALSSLTEPTKTANMLVKKKLSFGDGFLAVVLGSLVPAIILAAASMLLITWILGIVASMPMMGASAWIAPALGATSALIILVAIPASVVIAWAVGALVVWIVGSALGGKGNYTEFAAVWAFPMAAVVALSWIPIVNMLVSLYSIYLLYAFLQPTMKMDANKAAITVVVLFVLGVIVWAAFGSSVMWSVPAR